MCTQAEASSASLVAPTQPRGVSETGPPVIEGFVYIDPRVYEERASIAPGLKLPAAKCGAVKPSDITSAGVLPKRHSGFQGVYGSFICGAVQRRKATTPAGTKASS